jgi:hypothetical protein
MSLSRRAALAIGLGGTAAAMTVCSADRKPSPQPYCVSRASLARHGSLRGARLVYDISQIPTGFWFDRDFYGRLGVWFDDYLRLTGGSRPDQVWTYGSWLDGHPGCTSWHDAGRAFDLSRLVTDGAVQVSCRYDIWRHYSGSQLHYFRTRYWALAASLHLHFAYVLTYLYNADHDNHIHIDNGRSGDHLSTFDPDSPSQVQAIQGMLTHVWDKPVPITGEWDRQTREATGDVLQATKTGGTVDDGDEHWRSFLRRTAARPSGS